MSPTKSNLERIESYLKPFPRVLLANTPTPLEKLPRLSSKIGGPTFFAKRDDMTGFASGGNKARQLEFSFGEACSIGADTVLITGAVQSNYIRSAAAAAAKLGMACHVQLEDRVAEMDSTYHATGNVLLNKIFGATSSTFHLGENEAAADSNLENIAEKYRKKGHNPYLLTLSADTKPLGSLGYMICAAEILDQIDQKKQTIDAIVLASGSAATHVGTLLGLRLLGSNIPVYGICVRRDKEQQYQRVKGIIRLAEELINCGEIVNNNDIKCHDEWLSPGYGKTNKSVYEALMLAGQLEGMILDPVYTAKSFAGAIGLSRQGLFTNKENILYIHTGGMPALFAYEKDLTNSISSKNN
jgi:D-cysteine desulfhydrase family pyridoxal phosphate-dependent enzyme